MISECSTATRLASSPLLFTILLGVVLLLGLVSCDASQPDAAAPGVQADAHAVEGGPADQAQAPTTPSKKKSLVKPAAKGMTAEGELQLSPEDRCPVCGMTVHDRKFASGIEFVDGETHHFCGTRCMLKAYLFTEDVLARPRSEIQRAVTRDYFSGAFIDAEEAYWIDGSDVVGAMGPMLVPLASEEDVKTFTERHGGEAPFRLSELDETSWKGLFPKMGEKK